MKMDRRKFGYTSGALMLGCMLDINPEQIPLPNSEYAKLFIDKHDYRTQGMVWYIPREA